MADFNLGTVTAYGYAKDKGYTGTEEEFAALMASYASVAEEAAESAEDAAASAQTATTKAGEASASATAAATAKTAAQTAQSNAETAAQTATTKAGEASVSATTASSKASQAATSATTATNKATEAAESATSAAGSATTATTKAGEASTSATNAENAAQRAEEAAETLVIDTTLSNAGQAADAKKTGDELSSLKEDFSDIADTSEVQTEIASEQVDGLYIGSAQFGTASASNFWVKTIPVEAGKTYRIVADQIKTLFDQYALVAFSEQYPAPSVSLTVLVNGSTTVSPIDYTYTPEENGYISVALHKSVNTNLHFYEITDIYHVITDKTLAEINMPADAKETGDRFGLLGYTTETEKEETISAEHIVTDRYIATHGTLKAAGSTAFAVAWYPVKKGSTYTISGTASVGGNGQALICFDNVYDSTTDHVCKTVIQTAPTTDTP